MEGSGIGQFIPLILIFVIFYFFLIRPQQKKVKEHREMLNNLKRGDKIITSGGIIGKINKVNENKELNVEISNDVEIKIAPGMVADLYTTSKDSKFKHDDKSEKKKGIFSGLLGNKK